MLRDTGRQAPKLRRHSPPSPEFARELSQSHSCGGSGLWTLECQSSSSRNLNSESPTQLAGVSWCKIHVCDCARFLKCKKAAAEFTTVLNSSRQLNLSVMRYSNSVHQALGLLVITTILKCNCAVTQHAPLKDAVSFHDSDSRYGRDFRIEQASLSQSFRFADYNTTDTELLFSEDTIRQAQVAAIV